MRAQGETGQARLHHACISTDSDAIGTGVVAVEPGTPRPAPGQAAFSSPSARSQLWWASHTPPPPPSTPAQTLSPPGCSDCCVGPILFRGPSSVNPSQSKPALLSTLPYSSLPGSGFVQNFPSQHLDQPLFASVQSSNQLEPKRVWLTTKAHAHKAHETGFIPRRSVGTTSPPRPFRAHLPPKGLLLVASCPQPQYITIPH